ncbi:MAG: hypothetical protein HOY79_06085 [Streptomyces sp.]|nr:hypothetical protein [Streptomyces sp.]
MPPAAPTAEDLAAADDPTNDVLWGDDDTVIVLMSDEERRAYWLELDPERATVLRRNLAGPDREPTDEENGRRPCGHDDYHDPHEWHDRPGVWCTASAPTDRDHRMMQPCRCRKEIRRRSFG